MTWLFTTNTEWCY